MMLAMGVLWRSSKSKAQPQAENQVVSAKD